MQCSDEYGTYLQCGKKSHNYLIAWSSLVGIGSAAIITSIPILGVGYTRQKNAMKMFNEQNHQQLALTLNLQSNPNGFGLALNF